MTYTEALHYIMSNLPMFHRQGKTAYKADLSNILKLTEHLDQPQKSFQTIHIAGTNGKGSVSHMLAAIFQSAGYNTGLFTSPHLLDFRERIKVNGIPIPEDIVSSFIEKNKNILDLLEPSFFEMSAALAFDWFKVCKVDVAIIETGLGGRLDATNIIQPKLSIITNISFDHVDILGNTLGQIAQEKAGIIKNHIPVLIGQRLPDTDAVFINKALLLDAPICFAEDAISVDLIKTEIDIATVQVVNKNNKTDYELSTDLTGFYQTKNIPVVIKACEILKSIGWTKLTHENVCSGLANVKKLTGLRGRWEVIRNSPMIICDTGHNLAGIKDVVEQLESLTMNKLLIVFGMVSDKERSAILKILPKHAQYYFTKASIPRALDEKTLLNEAIEADLTGFSFPHVHEAIQNALLQAGSKDVIFIGGSNFIVAEALEFFDRQCSE